MERSEHGSVAHIVAIDDGMEIAEIFAGLRLDEDGSRLAVLSFMILMEILIPLLTAEHRVIDLCPGHHDPCDDVRIDLMEFLPVDLPYGPFGKVLIIPSHFSFLCVIWNNFLLEFVHTEIIDEKRCVFPDRE